MGRSRGNLHNRATARVLSVDFLVSIVDRQLADGHGRGRGELPHDLAFEQ
jgi:hypothetical protein